MQELGSLLRSRAAQLQPAAALSIFLVAVTIGAFAGGLWAALGICGGLLLYGASWARGGGLPRPPKELAFFMLAALGVMAALNLQSSQPVISWIAWIKLVSIFVPLLLLLSAPVVTHSQSSRFFEVLPLAMVAGGLALSIKLYLMERHLAAGELSIEIAHYNRGFSYLVLLAFPVTAALWVSGRRKLILPFLLLLLVPAELSESRSTKLAVVLASGLFSVACFAPLFARWFLGAVSVATTAWPFAAQRIFSDHADLLPKMPKSWLARMEIWDYMSYRILERPWLGWGLGTGYTLDFKNPHGALYVFTTQPAGHPHNVMTELWVELGVPGLLLGLGFAFLTLGLTGRLDRRLQPFALGAWVVGFVLSLIAYNFWTDSLFASFALVSFAFLMLDQKLRAF